jgi:hypothetical protein
VEEKLAECLVPLQLPTTVLEALQQRASQHWRLAVQFVISTSIVMDSIMWIRLVAVTIARTHGVDDLQILIGIATPRITALFWQQAPGTSPLEIATSDGYHLNTKLI